MSNSIHIVTKQNAKGADYYLFEVIGLRKRKDAKDTYGRLEGFAAFLKPAGTETPKSLVDVTEDNEGNALAAVVREEVEALVVEAFLNDNPIFLSVKSIPSCNLRVIEAAIPLGEAVEAKKIDYSHEAFQRDRLWSR